jgi:hypothetical protein
MLHVAGTHRFCEHRGGVHPGARELCAQENEREERGDTREHLTYEGTENA